MRIQTVGFRPTDEEQWAKLEALVGALGLSRSEVLREALDAFYEQHDGLIEAIADEVRAAQAAQEALAQARREALEGER